MSSRFGLLGRILNIARILGVINRYMQGFRRHEAALKTSEAYAKPIEEKIRRLNYLHVLEGLQSEILQETIEDFESIRQDLLSIQDKVVNRSYVQKILLAPGNTGETERGCFSVSQEGRHTQSAWNDRRLQCCTSLKLCSDF